MKTIVLATDFSENSWKAALFATQLAKDWKANLILLNAYHFWPENPAKTGDFPLSVEAMHDQSQTALEKLANELHEAIETESTIRCIAKEGYTRQAIRHVTESEAADLLIMSTVGTAPQSARLMGSIATDMVAESKVPLLLVPPGFTYTNIRNLVLAVDLDTPPDAIALENALELARLFDSVVNIICVNDTPDNPDVRHRAEQIRHLVVPLPHTMTIVAGLEIHETILDFAHENKADLIMMLPQTHNWFHRYFTGGETERVARLTDIPLLAVGDPH